MKRTIFITIVVSIINMLLFCTAIGCNAGEGKNDAVTILEDGVYFNGNAFVPFKEIIIKDGTISSIQSVASNTKGTRISVKGKFIIPGLTDAHVHIGGSPAYPYIVADPKLNANSSLNCGVTTMIDLFYQENECREMKQETSRSPQYYSTLLMAGPILTAPGGHGTEYGVPTRTITSVEEAKKVTNEVIDGGADVIKLVYEADASNYIPSITKEMVKTIVLAAHKRNKKVFAHIDRAAQAVDCTDVGVDIIAHMPADSLTDEQLQKIKTSGAVIIPTISVLQSVLEGHDVKYMSDPLLWKTANPDYMKNFSRGELAKVPISKERISKYYGSVNFYSNLKNCIRMHIPLLAGTDAGNYAVFYGYSLHNEMLCYVAAGMTTDAALRTATQNIDLVFPGIKTGKITTGYDADMVVLNADPLSNIEHTKAIDMVFHKGILAQNLIADAKESGQDNVLAFDPSVLDFTGSEALPPYIFTYNDNKYGGSSEINAQLQMGAVRDIHLTGKIIKKGYMGFAGLSFNLSKNEKLQPVDVSKFSAIEFDVKGNGETYYLQLISGLVKDYNFHAATFNASSEWKTIRISFNALKQNANYGKQMPLDLKTIKLISFTAGYKDYTVDLYLKNIHLVQ